ncbi:hypothetical protein Tco_1525663 [Tanacetum coccineum]
MVIAFSLPENLSLFRFSAGPDIGGGALNFTVSIARISFRDLMSEVNLSCLLPGLTLSFLTDLQQPLLPEGKLSSHSSSHLRIWGCCHSVS